MQGDRFSWCKVATSVVNTWQLCPSSVFCQKIAIFANLAWTKVAMKSVQVGNFVPVRSFVKKSPYLPTSYELKLPWKAFGLPCLKSERSWFIIFVLLCPGTIRLVVHSKVTTCIYCLWLVGNCVLFQVCSEETILWHRSVRYGSVDATSSISKYSAPALSEV
jgi:hypothetical protein